MYKSILVPLGGGDADFNALDAAFAIARRFSAHIDCFHGYMRAGEAAAASKQVPFLVGPALHDALDFLEARGVRRRTAAHEHFSAFCECHDLHPSASAASDGDISISIQDGAGGVPEQLVFQGRHHDLVVMARPAGRDGLPPDLLSRMLIKGGQPLLLVPASGGIGQFEHPLLCWKDTAETARAISAAMPLLREARLVTLLAVDDGGGEPATSVDAVMRRLARQGVRVEEMREGAAGERTKRVLERVARERGADYLVMGAHSKGSLQELLFGSCTQDTLDSGDIPALLAR